MLRNNIVTNLITIIIKIILILSQCVNSLFYIRRGSDDRHLVPVTVTLITAT
jgi:hypothetical protein